MRSFISNYLRAEKARREENGEAGFSLIELIVVVVILGILAAVAIPVFLGLQGRAEDSARESVAANGASQLAAKFALDTNYTPSAADFTNLTDGSTYVITPTGTGVDDFCVRVVSDSKFAQSGPGCTGNATGAVSGG